MNHPTTTTAAHAGGNDDRFRRSDAIAGDELTLPDGFIWGSATSSFQIEGSPDADGKSESIWDRFCSVPGNVLDGTDGDVACDHYTRWSDDVALMASMGLHAYRFSIAWTRVLPGGTGAVNHAGLDFYDRLVDGLLSAGITPMPTLYHWDLPQVLDDQGGWLSRDTAHAFADYAEAVVERLGDRIGTWTTLNEPFVSANHGYVTGEHAPGHTSLSEGFAASHHLLLAHGLAGERIRSAAPDADLAIVLNFTPATPASDDPADIAECAIQNDLQNRWYADPVGGLGYPEETAAALGWDRSEVLDGDMALISMPIDLLGVNFYSRQIVRAPLPDDNRAEEPKEFATTAMGWEIHPPSLGELLRELDSRYGFSKLMITENGCAMPDDTRVESAHGSQVDDLDRLDYVQRHIAQVHSAIEDGVPVVGYLVWSLFDNFEWAWGYTGRFGIVEVDFDTQRRTPKRSADWFSKVAASNVLADPGPEPESGSGASADA
ncbi:MAG: GH1 family beta-glucosidase [Ilumatobacter sp.]|uniref:GH1 family beta-glucosidase n=1 Tax=Ilumatobacter sp. TaxID=1967498 RepID=UPI003C7780E5